MYTNIRIVTSSSEIADEFINRCNFLVPGFCRDNGKNRFYDDVYTFSLSKQMEWQENYNEMLDLLTKLSSALSFAKENTDSIEIDIGIFLNEYQEISSINLEFSCVFFQICSKHDIHFGISVYAAKFKSKVLDNKCQ
jgi:hypothetical protein